MKGTPPEKPDALTKAIGEAQIWSSIGAFLWDIFDKKRRGINFLQDYWNKEQDKYDVIFRIRNYAKRLTDLIPSGFLYRYLADCMNLSLEEAIKKWDGSPIDPIGDNYMHNPTRVLLRLRAKILDK